MRGAVQQVQDGEMTISCRMGLAASDACLAVDGKEQGDGSMIARDDMSMLCISGALHHAACCRDDTH